MKKLFALMLILALISGVSAPAEAGEDWELVLLTAKTAEIVKYYGSASELEIPSRVYGYTITSMASARSST